MPSFPRQSTHRSEKWLRAVASLDCVVCGVGGQTQAAHRNEGKSMSAKTDDALTAALCVSCHRELDQGKTYDRDQKRAIMDSAILKTLVQLAREGLVRA
jgi:cytochrome c553